MDYMCFVWKRMIRIFGIPWPMHLFHKSMVIGSTSSSDISKVQSYLFNYKIIMLTYQHHEHDTYNDGMLVALHVSRYHHYTSTNNISLLTHQNKKSNLWPHFCCKDAYDSENSDHSLSHKAHAMRNYVQCFVVISHFQRQDEHICFLHHFSFTYLQHC